MAHLAGHGARPETASAFDGAREQPRSKAPRRPQGSSGEPASPTKHWFPPPQQHRDQPIFVALSLPLLLSSRNAALLYSLIVALQLSRLPTAGTTQPYFECSFFSPSQTATMYTYMHLSLPTTPLPLSLVALMPKYGRS